MVLIAWRRWRHLAVFAGSVVLVAGTVRWFPTAGVKGTGVPGHPSFAAAGVAVTLVAAVYGLVRLVGRGRSPIAGSVALCIALAVVDRNQTIHSIRDRDWIRHRLRDPVSRVQGVAPETVSPVSYRRGRTAHLHLDSRRLSDPHGPSRPAGDPGCGHRAEEDRRFRPLPLPLSDLGPKNPLQRAPKAPPGSGRPRTGPRPRVRARSAVL